MRGELSQFKRCCFCLPLRYGLIAWGYFKLILGALIIFRGVYALIRMIYHVNNRVFVSDMVIVSVGLFMFVTEFVLTTVFVIGGHMKNARLLRIFYYYSQVMWAILVLLFSVALGFSLYRLTRNFNALRCFYEALDFSFYFTVTAVHFYILLLLRSEIIKLESNCEFRFVNNAADAESTECTMTCHGDVIKAEKGIEAV